MTTALTGKEWTNACMNSLHKVARAAALRKETCPVCDCEITAMKKDWMEYSGSNWCEECSDKARASDDGSGERMAMNEEMADYNKGL